MGDNTLERMARIIDPTAFKAWQSSYDYNLAQGETDEGARGYADWSQKAACDEALAKAREILAALREPSDAMIEAGEMCDAADVWRSMIDAILNEGNE